MPSNSQKPQNYDAVLGGGKSHSSSAAILGGLSGVKYRLKSSVVGERVVAVQEALNYGQEGFPLVLEALQDPHFSVRYAAYLLLPKLGQTEVTETLLDSNPYQKFRCLYRYSTAPATAYTLAISPDGQFLASGSDDTSIKVRSLTNGKIIRTLAGHWNSVSSLVFHPHKEVLVSGSWDRNVKVWRKEALIRDLSGHQAKINTVTISPDGQLIASGSQDGHIKIWHVNQLQPIHSWQGHEDWVNSLVFTPDSNHLISCSSDCTIKIWHVQTQELTHTFTQSDRVKCLALSCNGKFLITGSQDKFIYVIDLSTREFLHTLKEHWGEINSLAISQEGQTLVSAGLDETINIWHIPTGICLHSLSGHESPIFALAISPDGKKIVSAGKDRKILVWGA